MRARLNKIISWLGEIGISSKVFTGGESVIFYIYLPDMVFEDGTHLLAVNMIPFFRDGNYGIRIVAKANKSMFLAHEKETITHVYDLITKEWAKDYVLYANSYDSKYGSMFSGGWNVLLTKQVEGVFIHKIISSKQAAIEFFKDESEVLKELLAQVKQIANLDLNSDLFYQRFFPDMDKNEVNVLFNDMATSMCEKPPKKLIGFAGDIPKEISEQRIAFTDLLKCRVAFLKIREILGN